MARDHAEIRTLLAEYCHLADSGDAEGYAALFTADGELVEEGVTITPPHNIARLARRFVELSAERPQPSGSKHITVNSAIRLGDESATARSDLLALKLDPQSGWQLGGVGQYEDELVRTGGGWRFRRRVVTWYGDLGPNALDPAYNDGITQLITSILEGA
jgi:hypothetical protein